MKFLEIVKKLQNLEENEGYLVLVRCGIFFDAIGKGGVILAERFGFNPICMKEKLCKCAVPVKTIDKFIRLAIDKKISVAIYDYKPDEFAENEEQKYELLKRITLCPIEEYKTYINCNECWYKDKRLRSGKDIIESTIQKLKEESKIDII